MQELEVKLKVQAQGAADVLNAIREGRWHIESITAPPVEDLRPATSEDLKAELERIGKLPMARRTQAETNLWNDWLRAAGAGREWAYFVGANGIETRPI